MNLDSLSTILRTVFFYLLTGIAILIAAPIIIIVAMLPADWRYTNKLFYSATFLIYKAIQVGSGVRLIISGQKNIPPGPIILAANHQSALDISFLGLLFGRRPHIWFFKHELTKIPVLGWVGKRMCVSVDRGSPRRAVKSLTEGLRLLQEHHLSLGIFPEGERFADGKVHDFLWGFAIIAKNTKLPVVPVFIKDAYKAYPRGSYMVRKATVNIHIGHPFYYRPDEDDDAYRVRVQEWFIEQSKK